MKAIEFCYWLQGYFEILEKNKPLTAEQAKVIKQHLQLVFKNESSGIHVDLPNGLDKWIKPKDWPIQYEVTCNNQEDLSFCSHVNAVMEHEGSC